MSAWWPRFGRRAPPFDDTRWIVLDVESSGLDPARDRLLAVAAVALVFEAGRPLISLGDSFEVVLRQAGDTAVDKPNILLHGIGVGTQRNGTEPSAALEAFERWTGSSPLIAFHAAFDETLIQRTMKAVRGHILPQPWVDLAHVAEVARPDAAARSLDEWLALYGLTCAARHQAAADALVTAELLLRLWPLILAQRAGSGFAGLLALARQRRWLQRG